MNNADASQIIWNQYCGEDIDLMDHTSYDPPCKFPFINKGFGTDTIEEECSWTYAEANGSIQMVINAVYFVMAIVPMFFGIHYRRIVAKARAKQNRKMAKLTLIDKLLLTMVFFSFTVAVNCTDLNGNANILPLLLHTEMQSLGIFFAIHSMRMLICEWVTIIKANGSKRIMPMWLHIAFWVGTWIQLIGMCVVCPIEYYTSKPEDDLWAFDGTLNAAKNLITALDLIIFSSIGIKYGVTIKNILGEKNAKEQKKIKNFLKVIAFWCVMTAGYQLLALSRIGKTVHKEPPCNGASWVHPIEMICILVNWYTIYSNRPTEESVLKGDANASSSPSIRSSIKSTFKMSSKSSASRKTGDSSKVAPSSGAASSGAASSAASSATSSAASSATSSFMSSASSMASDASGVESAVESAVEID